MSFKRLYYFKESIKFQLETLRQYIQESQDNLKSKQITLDNELKAALAAINDSEEERHIIDFFLDENLKYYEDFPKYLSESTFLIIYSFFEANLARICKYARLDINAHRKKELIRETPKGIHINHSKEFLKKSCKLPLGAEEKTWKKINKLKDYRNFITHNNSDLKHLVKDTDRFNKRKTISYINRVFGKCIEIDNLERCKIENPKLIMDTLNLVEKYLYFTIDKAMNKVK